jgi:ferredoxin--NADP+ reductase
MTEVTAPDAQLKYTRQSLIAKTAWESEKLFSVRITRDPAFEFIPGQFARLGLAVGGADHETPNQWRAYSMVSHPTQQELEFFSVCVPDGVFSPALARLTPGDPIWVDKTCFGFLTLERFPDGDDLWLIATGTGLSAYLSMLRDPTTWKRFKHIILVHGVRLNNELAYSEELLNLMHQYPGGQFVYLPVTSQEEVPASCSPSIGLLRSPARITTLLSSGELEQRTGVALAPLRSRIMLCGNPAMVTEMRAQLSARGFVAGRRGVPGNLAVENYW